MANEEHLARLKQGVEAWDQWREENPDIRPNLTKADLTKADLSGENAAIAYQAKLRADGEDLSTYAAIMFVGADLSGADLSGANFHQANLTAVRLNGADLSRANLNRANLGAARLRGAHLRGADLTRADFTEADLGEADLTEANINGTNLSETDLTMADFTRARIGGAVFGNADLSRVRGLDTAEHFSPSSIGIDTIYYSAGDIPEVFLRGAGVPEEMITYMKSLVGRPFEFYSCFISYNHTDKSFARRLHDQLQGHGIRCWLDEHQMHPGDDIYEEIDRGIRFWDKVLLCCSQASLTSWWVDTEINKAFEKERRLMKERGAKVHALVPLDLDGFLFKWTSGKAEEVKARLAADFTGWKRSHKRFERAFEHTVRALRADEGAREAPPVSKL